MGAILGSHIHQAGRHWPALTPLTMDENDLNLLRRYMPGGDRYEAPKSVPMPLDVAVPLLEQLRVMHLGTSYSRAIATALSVIQKHHTQ